MNDFIKSTPDLIRPFDRILYPSLDGEQMRVVTVTEVKRGFGWSSFRMADPNDSAVAYPLWTVGNGDKVFVAYAEVR